MKKLKTISLMTKIWFVVSLLILLLWVIPTMVSFYKKQKIYDAKVEELKVLDKRDAVHSETKPFHAGMFKKDAERYFSSVAVDSIANNEYEVEIVMDKSKISTFNSFLKKISLDYAISIEDTLLFKEINDSMSVKMVLKPYL
jgi:hypothetical protein